MNLDVAVVGASTAGLFAAERLARAGARVAIFERADRIDPPRRTLIITPQLHQLLGDLPPAVILHRTPIMAVESGGACVEIALQTPDLIVERGCLTRYLAERTQSAGATLHLSSRFQGMDASPTGAVLRIRRADGADVSYAAQAVIGADGAFSAVGTAVGIPRPATVSILQAEIALPTGWNPAATKVWFDVDATRFFFWLVPESADRGVVGLIGDSRADAREIIQIFLRRLGVTPQAYQAARVVMHDPSLRPWSSLGPAPVLLVGEAAGHVKTTTVGGTVSGLWGAAAAARSLVEGVPYAQTLQPLKRELDVHWFIRRLLDRLDNPGYDRLVHSISPGVHQFLARHNRDAMAGAIWKLPFYDVRLLALGAQLLLRSSKSTRALPEGDLDALPG